MLSSLSSQIPPPSTLATKQAQATVHIFCQRSFPLPTSTANTTDLQLNSLSDTSLTVKVTTMDLWSIMVMFRHRNYRSEIYILKFDHLKSPLAITMISNFTLNSKISSFIFSISPNLLFSFCMVIVSGSEKSSPCKEFWLDDMASDAWGFQ